MIDGDGVGIFGGGSDSLHIDICCWICQGFFNHLCLLHFPVIIEHNVTKPTSKFN